MPANNATPTRTLSGAATWLAWASVTFIVYATLARVDFVYGLYYKISPYLMQPQMKIYAHFVHFMAFALVGALFSFIYPQRTLLIGCLVLGSAAILEVLQTLTPDRHGTLVDAYEKMIGGAAGIAFAKGLTRLLAQARVNHPKD